MQQEYETKILDINVTEIEEKLQKLGATLVEDEGLMKRWIFDIEAHDSQDITGKRLRLRQKGNKAKLTYKQRGGNQIGSTQEIETSVGDFDDMADILKKLEWTTIVYQENKRKVYSRNDIEFCIDTRPKVPTYLEIEGKDEKAVYEGLEALGLTGKDEGDIGVIAVYRKYGMDLHSYPKLTFETE